ncbi:FtsQ-type POTRA domain-containing protein [Candidatus Nomurabacteria bacterium]|nr:FtsQ-type POTRA domain-containing protein [Candidatus Nomurabacteria bacterium]MCB9826934.1 FtsQ-type POTRA domain-containing protein [Candidatus Nomurabacteria bacterium]MCB9828036.1 FtsQ-type POTRA domain-containing protein [Candidatus Nomurabacteria bacterium]
MRKKRESSAAQRRNNSFIYAKRKAFMLFRRFTAVLVSLTVICAFAVGVKKSILDEKFFNVSSYIVVGAGNYVNKDDVEQLVRANSFDQLIFRVDVSGIESRLLEIFKGGRKFTITKEYPDKLKIEVVERKPIAIISNPGSEDFFIVDDEGYLLGQVDRRAYDLPIISYNGELQVGYTLDAKVVPVYLELLKALEEKKVKATSLSITNDYVRFYSENNVEVLVSIEKNIRTSVGILTALIRQLSLGGESFNKIDLRYDKVIVK